jgi:alkyl sulfatase BDS1-like metallo-beta-lactamase superfamily hydrolase
MEVAEDLWTGRLATTPRHPFAKPLQQLEEIDPGVAFVSSFANVTALATDAGLVLIDVGSFAFGRLVYEQVRAWSTRPLHTAVYTHGHIDHVFGVALYEAEPRRDGVVAPSVVAHEDLPARFDRYQRSAGYNRVINARQFGDPRLVWPTEYRYPDVVYRDRLALDVGGVRLELRHARGETDDHTWVWFPDRKLLCTGDLFIWATPNCGNPQKVQRYPLDWVYALRAMRALDAETLCPGHGFPIRGRDRIRQALGDTADLLASIHDQTLAMMNEGARLDDVVHAVRPPAELLDRPYLHPVYDEPEFIVRNVWRCYGGWYDGNPARLKPPPDAAVAREVAALAGGGGRLVARARALADSGDLALACHLVELAFQADPNAPATREARSEIYARRAEAATSLMARGVYRAAAAETRGEAPPPR